jgi:hypothetical protein
VIEGLRRYRIPLVPHSAPVELAETVHKLLPMSAQPTRTGVRLAELIAMISLGTDLGMGQPMEHVMRQSLIALRLAERVPRAVQLRSDRPGLFKIEPRLNHGDCVTRAASQVLAERLPTIMAFKPTAGW